MTATRAPTAGAASHKPLIAVSMFAANTARRSVTASGIGTTLLAGTT
jgi:hypothetical protein